MQARIETGQNDTRVVFAWAMQLGGCICGHVLGREGKPECYSCFAAGTQGMTRLANTCREGTMEEITQSVWRLGGFNISNPLDAHVPPAAESSVVEDDEFSTTAEESEVATSTAATTSAETTVDASLTQVRSFSAGAVGLRSRTRPSPSSVPATTSSTMESLATATFTIKDIRGLPVPVFTHSRTATTIETVVETATVTAVETTITPSRPAPHLIR
ncbi:hypothetical protein HK104_011422 [Borealophlyctis nickersoniae]|nr:hypothetical protein HK104_011422 [Borealophlyctis nickersoniae]